MSPETESTEPAVPADVEVESLEADEEVEDLEASESDDVGGGAQGAAVAVPVRAVPDRYESSP